jgi:hypothetical protein
VVKLCITDQVRFDNFDVSFCFSFCCYPVGVGGQEGFFYPANLIDPSVGIQMNASGLMADPNQVHQLQQQAQLAGFLPQFSGVNSLAGNPLQTNYWQANSPLGDPNNQQPSASSAAGMQQMYQNMRIAAANMQGIPQMTGATGGNIDEQTARMMYLANLNPVQQMVALQQQAAAAGQRGGLGGTVSTTNSAGYGSLGSQAGAGPMPGMIPRNLAGQQSSLQGGQQQGGLQGGESMNMMGGGGGGGGMSHGMSSLSFPANSPMDDRQQQHHSNSVSPPNHYSSSMMNSAGSSGKMSNSSGNSPNNSNMSNYSNRDNSGYNRDNNRDYNSNNRRNNNGNNSNSNNSNNNGNNPVRDALVEEFRSTFGKSRQWQLKDLSNHIVAFCQDQHGSRFIQQRLEICSDIDKQLVFDEIYPSAQILMTDVFGNYVLQKLFEYGTPDQCETLASLLKGQAVQLSMQMYGCRVVQKALEYVARDRLVELVAEFDNPQVSFVVTFLCSFLTLSYLFLLSVFFCLLFRC